MAGFTSKWYEAHTGQKAPAKKAKSISQLGADDLFVSLCPSLGLPAPEPEHVFHPDRGWRMDYAWPAHMVYLEVEGGAFIKGGGGRHNRPAGFTEDMRKYNAASELGWRQLRALPQWLPGGKSVSIDGALLRQLKALLSDPSL